MPSAATDTTGDQQLLLKIAWLYYVQGLTQGDIAQRVGLSRPTIVRLLQQAREEGLVEIRLTRALPHTTLLETTLEQRFANHGLQAAIVVDVLDAEPKLSVARAAAAYLRRVLRPNHILGVGWSTTLSYIPAYFSPSQYAPARIVQLTGSVGQLSGANAYEIAIQLGQLLGVTVEHMPTPAIVQNVDVRQGLLQDPGIRRTLQWAAQCNIGVVGIGVTSHESTLIKTEYLSAADLQAVAQQGAVGDILSHYYDVQGQELATPWRDRIMAIDLQHIRQINNLVAVACGAEKRLAVLGALSGGYVNTLIVDRILAEAVVESSAKHQEQL